MPPQQTTGLLADSEDATPAPVCQVSLTNPRRVATARERALPEATLNELHATYRVLGDPTRLKLLWALADQELCVCDLAEVVGLSVSAVSHQLRKLRDRHLVRHRREGQLIYYRLNDRHIPAIVKQTMAHLEESA